MNKQNNDKHSNRTPNPKGREGKPIVLPEMSFDEAVRKMLSTQPPKIEPKAKPRKKPVKRKS
jgi:hypothetical protein